MTKLNQNEKEELKAMLYIAVMTFLFVGVAPFFVFDNVPSQLPICCFIGVAGVFSWKYLRLRWG